jgi:integrase
MKSETFPLVVTEEGVSAKIRKATQTKEGRQYTVYIVEYNLLGQRKREARSSLVEAKQTARDAWRKISRGEQLVLELRSNDRLAYLREMEALQPVNVPIDTACREYTEAVTILSNVGSLTEAARLFVKQKMGVIEKSVPDAVDELVAQIETEQNNTLNGTRRKDAWLRLIRAHLVGKLARDFQCQVTELTSATLEPWLIGLKGAERTRCNIRDCVGYFLRWARGRNYLPKDAAPLANVQKFRKRKRGAIKVITHDEQTRLLAHSEKDFVPYLALRAFAGLRDCEARALDWQFVDLAGGWIDIPEQVAKQADDDEGVARMVKVRPVLSTWLQSCTPKSGPICPYANAVKKLSKVAKAANVKLPKNALRHSFISARRHSEQ